MPRWAWIRIVLAALLVSPAVASATTIGWVTIVDGASTVQRGGERFAATEGERLRADDVLETTPATLLVRIELDDGKTIDLGPSTLVTIHPRTVDRETRRVATVRIGEGWVKIATPAGATASLASARIDVLRIAGTAILRAGRDESWLFVESGTLEVAPRQGSKAAPRQPLAEGDSFVVQGGGLGSTSWLASSRLLAQLPRAFIDTLPRRAQRFAANPKAPS